LIENFHRFNFKLHKEKEMVALRKSILLLAVTLIVGGLASAQTPAFQCTANAGVPPIIRSEGITELLGDLILNCNGGTATAIGATVPAVNIQIFTSAPFTSRLLGDPWTEALLMIDEPFSASNPTVPQLVCGSAGAPFQTIGAVLTDTCGNTGTGIGAGVYSGAAGVAGAPPPGGPGYTARPNIFQGRRVSDNAVLFVGVPIDPPGTSGTRVIRITNIRANASSAGVVVGPGPFAPAAIQAFISATGSTSIPINNPQQTVAFVQQGLSFSLRDSGGGSVSTSDITRLQCIDFNADTANNNAETLDNGIHGYLRYAEGFFTSFKVRNAVTYGPPPVVPPAYSADNALTPVAQSGPGVIYNTETGFFMNTIAQDISSSRATGSRAGLADHGTRLLARFNNIPAGVAIQVGIYQGNPNTVATTSKVRLIGTFDPSGSGVFFAVPAINPSAPGFATVITAGSAVRSGAAVWEVMNADPLSLETIDIPYVVAFDANPGAGTPAGGTGTVIGSFAPISTVVTASSGAPIPRFVDPGTANQRDALIINPCVCNLLFPYVVARGNFDTGIAIANTSRDPFGTQTERGTVTINYFGTNTAGTEPPADTSTEVAPGEILAFNLLDGNAGKNIEPAAGFVGYIITQARFRFCHGFAFISNVGLAANGAFAQGYLGLVIDNSTVSITRGTGSPGEALGQ
jgi:hypothetical protein